jgi:hypothetical protein
MLELKHTPGNWRLANDAQGPCMVMHPALDGVAIASLTDAHKPANGFVEIESVGAPERTANARLIAAAPDLLEAIKELLAVSHNANIPDSEHIRHAPYKMIVVLKARAAIAKATGSEAT